MTLDGQILDSCPRQQILSWLVKNEYVILIFVVDAGKIVGRGNQVKGSVTIPTSSIKMLVLPPTVSPLLTVNM